MFAARTAKQQAARAAAAGSAAAGGVQASVGGGPGTSAVGASPAARTGPGSAGAAVSDYSGAAGAPSAAPQEQAARAAAAGSVAAGGVQASAGGAPGTSAVGASSAARTGPGSAGAAVSRYSGAAGAPSAAQHKVTAAPGARLAGVPQQPRTLRQRAQAEAFKSMMRQGLDEGSRAHAAAQTCTFTRPEQPAAPASVAREGQPQGRYVTDVIAGIVGVLRQHRDLASILHRKEMNMLLPGELKQLAEALQQQLPEKLRSSSVYGMQTWLHHHADEIELALAGVPNPDAVAAAAGVGGAAMPWEVQLGLQRVAEMMGLASDAEKQPAAEAWQERQWHTLTDCISATRAAARVAGDTAGAAGVGVGTGGAQTAAGGVPDIATSRLCDDAAAAQAMRQQMAAELPTQPCSVCGRRRRQRDVHWHRVSGLREWLDEQLSAMLPGTAEAPRDGNTLWAPPTSAEATALLAGATGAASMSGEASALLRTLRAEQEGYARARYGTAEEAAARGASTGMAAGVNSDSSSGSDSEAVIVQQSLARPSRKRPRLLSAAHMQRLLCGLDRDASVAVRQLLLAHNFKAAATKLLRHHGGVPTKEAVTQMQVLTDHERALTAEANASGSTRPLSRPPAGAPLPPGSLFVVHEPQALSPVQREHRARRPQSLSGLPAEAAQRAGAAALAAAAAGAEVAAAFSNCGQNVTHMQGIDDVDLSPTPADSPALRAVFQDACADERALQLLLDGWPLASCTEQAPQSDYQPEWPLRVHVNRFPNGTGACPTGMQMLSWIQLQLQRWYPPAPDGTEDCSAQAPHFILDMFDAWQRHTVNQQVAVRFKLDPQLIMSLGDMGPDTLVEAADVLAAGLSRTEQAQRLHGSPPEVEQLVRGARITGAHVVGSPGSYAALRSRAYGLWAAYGPPSASVTLNPASVHSDATFTLMGRPYTFDVRTGAPQHRPMAAERWDLVAGHPLACAESFEAFMDAFCDVFLGWPAGSDVQQRSNCLFGRVDAFFFKFEMNQRGELHVHGCIWQPGLQPARLRKALADPRSCPDVLLDFLESVQTQWFASPLLFSGGERPVHAQKLSTEQLQEVAEAAGSERLTELQRDVLREVLVEVKARGAMEDAAVSCRPPLQCSSLTEAERLGLFAAHAVLETLLHAHRDGTCTTSHSKHATDSNCRMRLPRMLHWLTTYLHEQSVCVHLKRYGRYMVSHMVDLLLAVPCNHTVTFACDVGRWLRTRELWDQRHEGIPRTDPVWERRPQLPSLEQLAADAADYALKYATKSEAVQGSRALIAAATMLRRRMHLMTPEQQAGIESEHLSIQDVLDQLRHPFAAFADASASAWAPRPPTAGVSAAGESSTPAQAQLTAEVTARAQQSATVAALRTARPVGAAAVQREGMFNLAHAINLLLTAQQTFSAPAAALLLMRGTDAHESHQFRAIDYRMFSQHVQSQLKRADPELRPRDAELRLVRTMGSVGAGGSARGEGQVPAASTIASDVPGSGPSGSVQQLEQLAVAPARYRSSSYLKDYLYRGEALRELSPMMMAMLFYKIPRANAWPAVGRTAAAAVVRSTQEWTHERLAAAQQRMHDYDLGGQYAAQALAQAQGAVQQQLLLYNSGTAAVTAKLVLISPLAVTTAAPEVQAVWPDAANPGAEPPYVLCPEDSQPTPEDTARLWNLSDDQQQAFMLYAQLLLAEAAGVRQPPVCSVLTGKAGSGKSRVLQALLWFAYQHRCESLIALVSYTWRAALHVSCVWGVWCKRGSVQT
ncbi:hypothetical protein CHLRE_02g142907v5 [Chlamydomonas reinhardtii]|uniref:Helitron helicase-like domain-containing protein n=1 Tax=Chlamydomonas reinhardtii TaxID=3055 RepID=A0A2K3E4H0_CHLRE|nr:uncharacterized protein CHLRE_02g142907v5 [Chlamydomonas reinhardtii]PNW87689.1 hypothetical protein CHLRE_02g142907v5 [Chlamydomonas reinhardtii]